MACISHQVNIMINMAEMVVRRVEKCYMEAHRTEQASLARALDAHSRPILFVDTAVDPWVILYCNSAAAVVRCRQRVGSPFWAFLLLTSR